MNDFDLRLRIVKIVNPCNLNGGEPSGLLSDWPSPVTLSDWWSSLIGGTGLSWTVVFSIEIEFRLNSRDIGSSVRLQDDPELELNAR